MKNNSITLWGKVSDFITNNDIEQGQNLTRFYLEVERLSGTLDVLMVHAQKKLTDMLKIKTDDFVKIEGQIRTINLYVTENNIPRNKVLVYVYAENIDLIENQEDIPAENNIVETTGNICRLKPIRHTPSDRLITDAILSVHRRGTKHDFIPLVVWGNDAVLLDKTSVGTQIKVKGRMQSRAYYSAKREQYEVAYEVSVSEMEILDFPQEDKTDAVQEEAAPQPA